MAGYKDSEIESAVSSFVQGDIKVQRDALGPVDVSAKFDESVRLISSTLIFDPNAIFYLIFLATNKLNVSVVQAISYVDDVLQAIDEMSHHTTDVTHTTLLGDAATALLTVDQILTTSDALSRTAFDRYLAAVNKFTSLSLVPNIKSGGEIVRTPQLARKEMRTTLPGLSASWMGILSSLVQLRGELDEFNALNLPILSVQSSVRKVRSDLRSMQDTFESTSTTRDDKIAACRNAYLRLTSGKAVLTNYTTVTDPSEPRLSSSSSIVGRAALPVGDKGALVTPEVSCTKSGPWAIVTGTNDELKVAVDGGVESTYSLVPPSKPSLTGYAAHQDETEFFEIVAGYNDILEFDGLGAIALTAGVGRTATQIVSDINTWITANYSTDYLASVVTVGGRSFVKIESLNDGIVRLQITATDPGNEKIIERGWATLGFYVGQEDSNEGISAAELAAFLNSASDFEAVVATTLFEHGEAGQVSSATVMVVPINTISSLAHVDDMLLIRSAENVGYHRIVSIARIGALDVVAVSTATPFLKAAMDQEWQILREVVTLSSVDQTLAAEMVIGNGNANLTLGFTAGTTKATTTGFRVAVSGVDEDFTRRDIVVGDVVRISTSPGVQADHVVLELADNNRQLELELPLETDVNVTVYPDLWFRVFSAAAIAYEAFESALTGWQRLLAASKFTENILELERVMNPLLANKQPSAAQVGDARFAANALRDLLTNASPDGLTEVLIGYVVAAVPRMDAALKMLKERGMDRAYDLLMGGEVGTFFGMDKDDAASSSYMLKSMRSVVQSDLRISKLDDDADEFQHWNSSEDTDADFDFSDADDDDSIDILGEVADYESTDSESAKKRY